MQPKTTTLLTAAVLAIGAPAMAEAAIQAQPAPLATSYADLLLPIPNAVERLKASDAYAAPRGGELVEDQYYHHHHHHHRHHNRRWYLNNGYSWYGGQWVLRPRYHHHHHHHNSY